MSVLGDALTFCERPAGRAALSVAFKMHSYRTAARHVLGSPTPSLRQHGEHGLREMLGADAGCSQDDAALVIRELLCLLDNPSQTTPAAPEAAKQEADTPTTPVTGPEVPDEPRLDPAPVAPVPVRAAPPALNAEQPPTTDLMYISVLQIITALSGSGLKVTYDELNQVREGKNSDLARRVLPLMHAHQQQLDALPGSRFAQARAQLQHAVFSLFDLDCPDALAPLCRTHGLLEYQAFADLCPPELLSVVIGAKTTLERPEREPDPALLTPAALCALENLAAILLHSGHLLQITRLGKQLLSAGWNQGELDRCLGAGGNPHLTLSAAHADQLSPDDTAGVFLLLQDLLHEERPGEQDAGNPDRNVQLETVRKGRHALKQARMPVDINDLAGLLRVRVSQLTLLLREMGAVRNGRDVTLLSAAEARGQA